MKKLMTGVALSLCLAAPAMAADMRMPVKAPPPVAATVYNWTGFYIGIHAGGTWGKVTATESVAPGGIEYNGLGNSWTAKPSGFVGGGQIGYNWQAAGSPLVFGIEGDIGYLDLSGSAVSPLAITQASGTTVTTEGNLYGTIRGRLGYAHNNVLIYGTGGAIFANVKGQITDPVFITPIEPSSRTGWQAGWTAGGGLEFGFANWSLKAEYLYFDLGKDDVFATHVGADDGHGWDIKTRGHIARLGLNYRFGAPVAARY